MKLKNILVFYKDLKLKEHHQVLGEIKRIFDKNKLKACFYKRNKFKKNLKEKYDLVLSVGGDGTLLRAAQGMGNAVIFGINSDHKKNEGALCFATAADLRTKLERIIKGDFFVKNFTRARICLKKSGKSYDALNEIYIGSRLSYHTSRYTLNFDKVKEEQKSSGIIVATGVGSTAWYYSIAQETFNPENKELRFVVREPYQGKLSDSNLTKATITGKQKLLIRPKMDNAIIAIDSIIELPLDSEEEIQVAVSPKPAKFVFLV